MPAGLALTSEERAQALVLVIEPADDLRELIETTLMTLGFPNVVVAMEHTAGLKRAGEKRFDFVLFDTKPSTISAYEFLDRLLISDEDSLAIPCTSDPNADGVFEMMKRGARGFLEKPIVPERLEEVLTIAAKGELIAEHVLEADDRNVAFASVLAAHLDTAAKIAQQSKRYDSAARELDQHMRTLRESTHLARIFGEGGEEAILKALEDVCLDRGDGPASQLGRARQRLRKLRAEKASTTDGPDNSEG